ncbi:MAG: hypothetical protein K0R54_929 [Clostridiaceae bacterium]|jgi:hypothetical protein|nr:hypothetical protein [Clostridiaceae bacterium]
MGLFSSLMGFFSSDEKAEDIIEEKKVENATYEIDEEEKTVVAIAASIMAAEDKPNSEFHISSITRIK